MAREGREECELDDFSPRSCHLSLLLFLPSGDSNVPFLSVEVERRRFGCALSRVMGVVVGAKGGDRSKLRPFEERKWREGWRSLSPNAAVSRGELLNLYS